jgi:hypothetical protein
MVCFTAFLNNVTGFKDQKDFVLKIKSNIQGFKPEKKKN